MRKFAERDADMHVADADADGDAVETLVNERFYVQPEKVGRQL